MELSGPDLDIACFGHPNPGAPFPGRPNNCVVDKIRQFSSVLAESVASQDAKTIALEFLLHFVGNVHQPLHSADNHDQGGNAVAITYSYSDGPKTRTKMTNLHSHGDTDTALASERRLLNADFRGPPR